MSALELALCLAALVAGLAGTWSPCGFSMIDTIAAGKRSGRRSLTGAACLSFGAGALAGGAALFSASAGIGALLASAGLGLPSLAAGGLAAGVALAELTGAPVRPQVRRQVPEHWRRVAPLPVATFGYGVLLGLGFTTFVLSLAVPALAAIALVLGEPALGLAIGLSFGAGRALPVVALAPVADTPAGIGAVEAMAERPASLRGLRALAGLALCACAAGLVAEPASAATTFARPATDPSAGGGALAWQVPGGAGVLRLGAATVPLNGRAPAVGGGLLAAIEPGGIVVVRRLPGLEPVFSRALPAADKLAVTSQWLIARERAGVTQIVAFPLTSPTAPPVVLAAPRTGVVVGRPSAYGDRVVWHASSAAGSRIVEANLTSGRRTTRLRDRAALLLNPSIDAVRMLYVRTGTCAQSVVLRRGGRRRVVARRRAPASADRGFEPGRTRQGSAAAPCPRRKAARSLAWTTALDGSSAYVTFMRPATRAVTDASVVRFPLDRRR